MLLHNDKDLFREVILSPSNRFGLPVPIIEKDYYVTLVLRELSSDCPECVFKGGTSLLKCHHVIDRFSEDIDISFSDSLTQTMRKHLKNDIIKDISVRLGLPITDWESARSRQDYNSYTFSYKPVDDDSSEGKLVQGVKMEVSLASVSFPTVTLPVNSYVFQFLSEGNMNLAEEFDLKPFSMNVQTVDRTLADKVFAICDYYLQGKTKRYSRHIYDIYMLLPRVNLDSSFKELVNQVRSIRASLSICPSAKDNINIPALLNEIIDSEFYKSDYMDITSYFQKTPLSYEKAISAIRTIAKSGMF